MEKGRIVAQGSFKELINHEILQHIIQIQESTRSKEDLKEDLVEELDEIVAEEPKMFKKLSSEDMIKKQ